MKLATAVADESPILRCYWHLSES